MVVMFLVFLFTLVFLCYAGGINLAHILLGSELIGGGRLRPWGVGVLIVVLYLP